MGDANVEAGGIPVPAPAPAPVSGPDTVSIDLPVVTNGGGDSDRVVIVARTWNGDSSASVTIDTYNIDPVSGMQRASLDLEWAEDRNAPVVSGFGSAANLQPTAPVAVPEPPQSTAPPPATAPAPAPAPTPAPAPAQAPPRTAIAESSGPIECSADAVVGTAVSTPPPPAPAQAQWQPAITNEAVPFSDHDVSSDLVTGQSLAAKAWQPAVVGQSIEINDRDLTDAVSGQSVPLRSPPPTASFPEASADLVSGEAVTAASAVVTLPLVVTAATALAVAVTPIAASDDLVVGQRIDPTPKPVWMPAVTNTALPIPESESETEPLVFGSSVLPKPQPVPVPVPVAPAPAPAPAETKSAVASSPTPVQARPPARRSAVTELIINTLDGSAERTARRRQLASHIKAATASAASGGAVITPLHAHIEHFLSVNDRFIGRSVPTRDELVWMRDAMTGGGALDVHWSGFVSTLLAFASDQQLAEWLPAASAMRGMIGTVAHSELGASRSELQTTATYDPVSNEFELNTGRTGSGWGGIKWCIPGVASVATHALVSARVVMPTGAEPGVMWFLCPLRSLPSGAGSGGDHKLLSGVEAGSVLALSASLDTKPAAHAQSKTPAGSDALDLGYLRLRGVRVPARAMLSRFGSIAADGQFLFATTALMASDAPYAPVLSARGMLIRMNGGSLARAVATVIRWNTERRALANQFTRLQSLQLIANVYALKITGRWLHDTFTGTASSGGAAGGTASVDGEVADLISLGALISSRRWLQSGLVQCRQLCTGSNASAAALLIPASLDASVGPEFGESENDMLLSVGRQLLMAVRTTSAAAAANQTGLPGLTDTSNPVSALNGGMSLLQEMLSPSAAAEIGTPARPDWTSLETVCSVYRRVAAHVLLRTAEGVHHRLTAAIKATRSVNSDSAAAIADSVLENSSASITKDVVEPHIISFILSAFVQGSVYSVSSNATAQALTDARQLLSRLALLFGLSQLLALDPASVAAVGGGGADALTQIRAAQLAVVDSFTPAQLTTLTDAFDVFAPVSKRTPSLVDQLFASAQAASKSSTAAVPVAAAYDELLRPRLLSKL